ncbi:MAG: type II toxin-antitoxin system VapC family toxin [Pseudomonadota bacterium]|nr:type II toxin-antitoxin system VapC family toxin [Pseudomonadota bacterium]
MAEEKKLKVYCETSFWSFLNGRPTPLAHIAVTQAATLQWWQEIAPKCEIYISQYVNREARGGDTERAALRCESMCGVSAVDASIPNVTELANLLMHGHAVPDCESTDAIHIAAAAVYGMDVLLTLNCKHMANPVTLPVTATIIAKAGYRCPIVITPGDFLERKEEFAL